MSHFYSVDGGALSFTDWVRPNAPGRSLVKAFAPGEWKSVEPADGLSR